MRTLASIAGGFAVLCMAMGIITATEVIPLLGSEFTWMFWLGLSGVLFLASIAFVLSRGEE